MKRKVKESLKITILCGCISALLYLKSIKENTTWFLKEVFQCLLLVNILTFFMMTASLNRIPRNGVHLILVKIYSVMWQSFSAAKYICFKNIKSLANCMRRNDNDYATKLWKISLRKHKDALVKTCDGKQITWRWETRIH